jgi:hypothetical protein
MNRALVNEIVSPLTISLGSDKTRISLALALGLSYIMPIPANRPKNPEIFFIENYMTKMNQFISEFNERFLIETTTVADSVRTVWLTRYNYVYLPGVADVLSLSKKACPVADYLAGYNLDEQSVEMVTAAAISVMGKLEAVWNAAAKP